jgi:hypothetical protein
MKDVTLLWPSTHLDGKSRRTHDGGIEIQGFDSDGNLLVMRVTCESFSSARVTRPEPENAVATKVAPCLSACCRRAGVVEGNIRGAGNSDAVDKLPGAVARDKYCSFAPTVINPHRDVP